MKKSLPDAALPLGDIRAGTLQVTLAQTPEDVRAAQELRYRVFVQEHGAGASEEMHAEKRDADVFDKYCDHVLVLEHAHGAPQVVGTYRLLRREGMRQCGKFYSADEFDIGIVDRFTGPVLELGRSCVDAAYRNRAVMQLLWRGNGAYVARHGIELMFGCGSLHGIDVEAQAEVLSYLHHYHLAPEALRLRALPDRFVPMDRMAKEAVHVKKAFAALPPLIKGYLRMGGYIGEGAVLDHDYNTIDVGIVVKTDMVTDKYFQRYGGKE